MKTEDKLKQLYNNFILGNSLFKVDKIYTNNITPEEHIHDDLSHELSRYIISKHKNSINYTTDEKDFNQINVSLRLLVLKTDDLKHIVESDGFNREREYN